MKHWKLIFLVVALLPFCLSAQEEDGEEEIAIEKVEQSTEVRFSKEELARETILPVFRNKSVVKNRTVSLANRIDLSLLAGKTLNDAFYDNYPLGIHVAYNFSETNALMIDFLSYSTGQNNFVSQVKEKTGDSGFSLDNVPVLQSAYALNWQYTPYYGKISFSKNKVFNLSIYTLAGVGKMNYTNSSSTMFQLAIGQKVYFSPSWGLKLDLRAKLYKFPDFLNDSLTPTPPYDDVNTFNLEMSVGLVYLLPSF